MLSPLSCSLAALLALTTSAAAFPIYTSSPSASNSSLQHCLHLTGGYQRSYPSSSSYASLSSAYNPLFTYRPYVIAVPSTTDEIAGIVKCVSAQRGAVKLSARSGGHSYQAYSLGGHDGSVVVDLRRLDGVSVDSAAKTATVAAGVRLGKLAEQIFTRGGFALPHGTCPLVGVAGHALGGGFGFTTRAWGFLLDRITEMQMVDVNGTMRTVNKDTNTDLWWALRGGGSNNFGIVTSFTFSLVHAPTQILDYAYNYKSNQDCARAIVALQNMTLATEVDRGLAANFGGELLVVGEAAGDFDGSACQLQGQHISVSRDEHDRLMARFHTKAGITPASTSVKPFSNWIQALQDVMGSLDVTSSAETSDHERFYAKSLIQPNTATYDYTSALTLVDKLNSYAGLHGTGNSISFDFLGPLSYPTARVDRSDSSFNAHDASFVYQFYSYGFPTNDNPQAQQEVWTAFDDMVETAKNSAAQAGWGAYVNYIDSRQHDWPSAYYGQALERLKQIKRKWDGEDVFWFPQGLSSA